MSTEEQPKIERSVYIHGKGWFDKVNGNSYFSARVYVDGEEVARLPFQYGYSDQYKQEGRKALKELGYLSTDFDGPLWTLRDSNIDAYYVIYEAKKTDVTRWGKSDN